VASKYKHQISVLGTTYDKLKVESSTLRKSICAIVSEIIEEALDKEEAAKERTEGYRGEF
jgi:hypothetical protein